MLIWSVNPKGILDRLHEEKKNTARNGPANTTGNAGDTVYLLTPFVDGGELFDWIRDNGASTEDAVKPLFRQIINGLRVREIKPPLSETKETILFMFSCLVVVVVPPSSLASPLSVSFVTLLWRSSRLFR